jgi:hypothetical protein
MTATELEQFFLKLRFDKAHHLGLGDVRLSLGQQDELIAVLRASPSEAPREGMVTVPKEVLEFYTFCDIAFVPFTGQHEELMKSLRLARKAMLPAAPSRSEEKE